LALNPHNGSVIWKTLVGPGSSLGGIEWGTAFDGKRIYVPIANLYGIPYALQPSGTMANGGSWAALDPATGSILWQTAVPGQCPSAIPGGHRKAAWGLVRRVSETAWCSWDRWI